MIDPDSSSTWLELNKALAIHLYETNELFMAIMSCIDTRLMNEGLSISQTQHEAMG